MKTGRSAGAYNRQAILNYVNAHPGAYGTEILGAIKLGKVTGPEHLKNMTAKGELRRERVSFRKDGDKCNITTFAYWANVKHTKGYDAEFMAVPGSEPEDTNAQRWVGGSYRNTRSDRPVTACPDAMSGIGLRVMTQLEATA